ncbi:MAG: ABC transporter ATP-binding protein, partial [Chloroflexota bacterium]|nr:ABC transporter ATP-binding protein [Chloroflexota bacterium]
VGASGCGKSTLLRVIGGLETGFSGQVSVGGSRVQGPSQAVGLVFQEPRLFPWLDVASNVAFGLSERASARTRDLVAETLSVVGLLEFATALPKQLSGGMAQRAALARALVTEPQVLLLDEPFSALDAFTRMRLQDHLLAAWARYRPTLLLVTHDLDEAVYLADRIVLLSERPATVQLTRSVPVPRPRARGDLALAALRAELLQALHLERAAA